GEPITGLEQGRPLLVRAPDSELRLGSIMRAHVYSIFATLAIGLDVLAEEGVGLEFLNAHGGLFRTAGVAQRLLAAPTGTPVAPAGPAQAHRRRRAPRRWRAMGHRLAACLSRPLGETARPLPRRRDLLRHVDPFGHPDAQGRGRVPRIPRPLPQGAGRRGRS